MMVLKSCYSRRSYGGIGELEVLSKLSNTIDEASSFQAASTIWAAPTRLPLTTVVLLWLARSQAYTVICAFLQHPWAE